jgi:phosphatidylserine/phosphatidylglycerophosphate/cardiolipin synthase-like enzyme
VFSIALPLVLATISPAVPAASVTSGAAIAVCFSPEEDCAAFAVRAINNAERQILVGAHGLTTGSGIVEALVGAKGRGVDVRLIADKTTPCPATNGIEPLVAAGVPIWIDTQARIAHAKTMVRLRILDAVAGPEPETSADQQREAGRERIERAFPKIKP